MGGNKFKLTLDYNVINHLGINLYSNIPAVISEAVANAWDADATEVRIELDDALGTITLFDNGTGMSVDDINNKYLKIGYQKRKVEGDRTKKYNRLVMGRKGIGKLSLFSIAKKIYVMSVDSLKVGQHEKVGLILDLEEIQEFIRNGSSSKETYYPIEIDEKEIDIAIGTKIILTELTKKNFGKCRAISTKKNS